MFVRRRGRTSLLGRLTSLLTAVPRERSELAYAAGYLGLLSLFRYSFAPLAMSGWWPAWVLGKGLALLFGLLAPLALALSFPAAVTLERSPERTGKLPTFVGFTLGWIGSYQLLFLLDEIWRWLASSG